MSDTSKDQQHPLYNREHPLVDSLLNQEATDYNLAELARLRIRYYDFPGVRDIQKKLDQIMQQWELSEEQLFEKTRHIHQKAAIYEIRGKKKEQDWN